MNRRRFLTTCAAAIVAQPAVAGTGGLFAGGTGPLINLQSGQSLYERNAIEAADAEPDPGPMQLEASAPRHIELSTGVPVLTMWNVHTQEVLTIQPAVATGVDMSALAQADRFMRDWRRNEVKSIDPNAILGMLQIQQAARQQGFSGQVRFLSGYRSRATNDALRAAGGGAARNSLHIEARAIDFSLPGVGMRDTIRLAKGLRIGGVGGYPSFVHIDTGRERYWGSAV